MKPNYILEIFLTSYRQSLLALLPRNVGNGAVQYIFN